MNAQTEADLRERLVNSPSYAALPSKRKRETPNWSEITKTKPSSTGSMIVFCIDPQPITFTRLLSGEFGRGESVSLIEEFLKVAYNEHASQAEGWTAQILGRLSDWEPKAELLAALTDFHVWPLTEPLKSKIREQLSDQNPLIFVAAAQLMVRGKIAFEGVEDELSDKRREAVKKLRAQFP